MRTSQPAPGLPTPAVPTTVEGWAWAGPGRSGSRLATMPVVLWPGVAQPQVSDKPVMGAPRLSRPAWGLWLTGPGDHRRVARKTPCLISRPGWRSPWAYPSHRAGPVVRPTKIIHETVDWAGRAARRKEDRVSPEDAGCSTTRLTIIMGLPEPYDHPIGSASQDAQDAALMIQATGMRPPDQPA